LHSSAILPHLIEEGSNYEKLTQTCTQQVNLSRFGFDELIPQLIKPSGWSLAWSETEEIGGGDNDPHKIDHEDLYLQHRGSWDRFSFGTALAL